ncbi:Integrator Complex Subunit 1 [Manis pentadactyla]|nr:Integrator Complex Subunit 1 [Manis pentadactyla]
MDRTVSRARSELQGGSVGTIKKLKSAEGKQGTGGGDLPECSPVNSQHPLSWPHLPILTS